MNRRLLVCVCGCLVIAGLLVAWASWQDQRFAWDNHLSGDAWVSDRSEQILSGLVPGQPMTVSFRLKNTAQQPLRLLGASAC